MKYTFHQPTRIPTTKKFGPARNDAKELASSMQVFLLSTLTGKKCCVNLSSTPVHKMQSEHLKNKLFECLDKAKSSDYTVVPIIIDGAATNCKVLKDVLETTNEKTIRTNYQTRH